MGALRGKRVSKVQKPLKKTRSSKEMGFSEKTQRQPPVPSIEKQGKMEAAQEVARQPSRNEVYFHHTTATRGGSQLAAAWPARGKRAPRNPPRKQLRLPGVRTRPSLCFPLVLSPAPSASSEEGWEPRARATTLPSVSSSTSSQTGSESVAAQAQAPRAEAAAVAAAGQCKMAAALVAAVDGAAGPGTVGAAAGRRMTQDGKRAAEPRRLPCL